MLTWYENIWTKWCLVCPQELVMDILRVLAAPDLEVRKKTLNLTMELVTSRTVEEVIQVKSCAQPMHWWISFVFVVCFSLSLSAGLPSHGGDVTVYVWHKPTELAHSFLSCLLSIFVFMALSNVLHSINSPDNSPFSHSVLVVLALPYWSFQLYISLWKSPSALI